MRTLFMLAAASLAAAPLAAQGWIEPLPGRPGVGVEKLRTNVSVSVRGRIATVEVEEWFRHHGGGLGEGDYLYPLPGEAVFSNYSLYQGDRELRGETMDVEQARAIYEEIVRRKKDPALIELVGHGLVRARVFPINPGETRKITLRYTQVLERAGDGLQFHYAAGGRTGQARTEGGGLARGRSDAPLTFTLTADSAAAFRDPFSPTHELEVERERGRLVVRPDGELHGDFTLFLPFTRDVVGLTLATHKPAGEDGYFMLTLSPGRAAGRALARDVTVVLDVSGSMSGEKIDQARAALHQLLGTLGPDDRFRLLAFSNRVSDLQDGWSGTSRRELDAARRWIDDLQANGGTNIEGALREAFREQAGEGRLGIVLFVTDGLPSVGEQDPERLAREAERARGDTRVFAFGVGYDVNTFLLDRLSAAGRGTTEFVEPGEDVESALSTLAAKISHPVLADLALADAPVDVVEVYPRELPDLFLGEELVIFGRYRTERDRSGQVAVTGRRNGRAERFGSTVRFPSRARGNDFIPQLWASRKIGELSRQLRLNGHNEELVEEIRETALRYGLLSEYTSYLVQEPEQVVMAGGMGRGVRRVDASGGAVAAAPAPAEAVGAASVARAEVDRDRREARTLKSVVAADEAVMNDLVGRAHGPNTRHVAGRLFMERNGVWTDLAAGDSLRRVTVEPFSAAYFTLIRELPEIEPVVQAFDRVVIAGKQVQIEVAPGGARELSPAAAKKVVVEFRGK